METQFTRTELLLGEEAIRRLAGCRVAVFGLGGVGSFTVEALARCGIGELDIVDDDKVCLSNINRQLYALHSTVGKYKVDVASERLADINPALKINKHRLFYLTQTAHLFDFSEYDYVVDHRQVSANAIKRAMAGTPIICSLGAGNKRSDGF